MIIKSIFGEASGGSGINGQVWKLPVPQPLFTEVMAQGGAPPPPIAEPTPCTFSPSCVLQLVLRREVGLSCQYNSVTGPLLPLPTLGEGSVPALSCPGAPCGGDRALVVIRGQDALPRCKVFHTDGTRGLWDGGMETLGTCPGDDQGGGIWHQQGTG